MSADDGQQPSTPDRDDVAATDDPYGRVPELPSWLVARPADGSPHVASPGESGLPADSGSEGRPDNRMHRWAGAIRGSVTLTLLVALATPLVVLATPVQVRVDGDVVGVHTYAATVGEVIERLAIDVGDRDVIEPGIDTRLADDMVIDVHRAITVDVHVDGALVHRVVAPVASIGAVLEQAGLGQMREIEARVSATFNAPVQDGGQVDVWLPREVTLTIDGDEHSLSTYARDIEQLLDEQDIELGPHDRISHALDMPLSSVSDVVVARIQVDQEIEEVVISHPVVREQSTEVWRGTIRVVQEGRDGVRYDRYRVVEVDGVQTERELISQQVAIEPQPRIVLVGSHIDWDALARCESGGNWSIDAHGHLDAYSDARYYGGLQFNHRSWRAAGGLQYSYWPHEASREQQIATAERLFELRRTWGLDPWSGWPACSRRLGIR
ncbi:MAG: ubiquitin-like domain-containing protein [Nitriliruptoraceae bacterium]